jgi:hypothetical protein
VKAVTLLLLGGLAFWLPEISLYAWERTELNRSLVTLLLPCTLVVAYALVSVCRSKDFPKPSAAIFMLIGVWLFGSLAISIGVTFLGGGFAVHPGSALLVVLLGTLLPLYVFIMATYDGSLYALIFATFIMLLAHVTLERHNWIFSSGKRA